MAHDAFTPVASATLYHSMDTLIIAEHSHVLYVLSLPCILSSVSVDLLSLASNAHSASSRSIPSLSSYPAPPASFGCKPACIFPLLSDEHAPLACSPVALCRSATVCLYFTQHNKRTTASRKRKSKKKALCPVVLTCFSRVCTQHDLALEHRIELESKMLLEGGSSSQHVTGAGRVEELTFHSNASSTLHRTTQVGTKHALSYAHALAVLFPDGWAGSSMRAIL